MPINPFGLKELTKLSDISERFPSTVVDDMKNIKVVGERQFKTFLEDRFIFGKTPISHPIKLNNIKLWAHNPVVKEIVLPTNEDITQLRVAALQKPLQASTLFKYDVLYFPNASVMMAFHCTMERKLMF